MTEIDINQIIDKVANITDRNLSMQSDFLRALSELKVSINSQDKDHTDIKEDISRVIDITNSTLSYVDDIDVKRINEWFLEVHDHNIKHTTDLIDVRNSINSLTNSYDWGKKIIIIMGGLMVVAQGIIAAL